MNTYFRLASDTNEIYDASVEKSANSGFWLIQAKRFLECLRDILYVAELIAIYYMVVD